MNDEDRQKVNAQLKLRGWPELPSPGGATERLADAIAADNASRPSPARDQRTPQEILEDQLVRRGFRPPRDAA